MSSISVSVKVNEQKVFVSSPYNREFVKRARELGGKWENDVWQFDARDEARVRELCLRIYGTDGTPTPLATIQINLDAAMRHNRSDDELIVGPVTVLKKFNRDSAPKLGTGCVVIGGGLKSYGGSRNNPKITYESDTIIEVRGVPQIIANKLAIELPEAYAIIVGKADDGLAPDEQSLVVALRSLSPERRQLVLAAI